MKVYGVFYKDNQIPAYTSFDYTDAFKRCQSYNARFENEAKPRFEMRVATIDTSPFIPCAGIKSLT